MKRIDELRQQIDACRAASDDLHLPELAELRRALDAAPAAEQDRAVLGEVDRARRFDRAVVSALHDAPVPVGMLDRLLEKLAEGPAVELPAAAALPSTELGPWAELGPSIGPRRSRRWLLAAGGLAAAAAVLLAVFVSRPGEPRRVSELQLAGEVEIWMQQALPQAGWSSEVANAPTAFAYDSAMLVKPTQWRHFRTPAREAAVVYDVTPPGGSGGRAFLFVVKTPANYAVPPLPFKMLAGTTGGVRVGAWQRRNLLYVLVIDKGGPSIDRLVREPRAA